MSHAQVLFVFAASDELLVEVVVAALVGHAIGVLLLLLVDGLVFRGGGVLPLVGVVLESLNTLGVRLLGHSIGSLESTVPLWVHPARSVRAQDDKAEIILSNWPSTFALKSDSIR